jgi:hypothetical protein
VIVFAVSVQNEDLVFIAARINSDYDMSPRLEFAPEIFS